MNNVNPVVPPLPPLMPLSNITPFTYRDGYTYLHVLEDLRQWLNKVVNNENEQNRLINETLEAQNQTISDLLSQLVGYTIQVDEFEYHASMMDGSEFTAYTIAGVDREISELSQSVDTRISSILQGVDDRVSQVETDTAAQISALTTHVDGQISSLTTFVNDEVSSLTTFVNNEIATVINYVDGQISTLTTHLNSEVERIDRGLARVVPASNYGAVGDGTTDDTSALQAWLDDGGTHLNPGTYLITSPLTVSRDDFTLQGEAGTKIISHASSGHAINITGDRANISNIRIDGEGTGGGGIWINGNFASVSNCEVVNMTAANARGIHVAGAGGHKISNNLIENIHCENIGEPGSGAYRASRGIMLHFNTDRDADWPSLIDGNIVRNIFGIEGDAIHVINSTGTDTRNRNGFVSISNNQIDSASRRFIKIQASDCTISDNTMTYSSDEAPLYPSQPISLLYVQNITVKGNVIRTNPLSNGIRIFSYDIAGEESRGCFIVDNIIEFGYSQSGTAIAVEGVNHAIKNNLIVSASRAVSVAANGRYIAIQGNTHRPGAAYTSDHDANSISTVSSVELSAVTDNQVLVNVYRWNAFNINGTNVLSENNRQVMPSD